MTIISCQCGKQFKAAPHLAGKRVACPACKQPLQIPAAPPTVVSCLCGQSFRAKPELAGKTLACPKCGNSLHVPLPGEAQPAPLADPFDFPSQPVAQPHQYQRPIRPAAQSTNDSNPMLIKLVVGIGGAIVALFVLLVVGSMLLSPAKDSASSNTEVANAEAEGSNPEASTTASSKDPPPTISPEESRNLPNTAAELEQFYRVPPGAEDTTQLWVSAILAFAGDQVLQDAAGFPVLTDRSQPIPTPDQSWVAIDKLRSVLARWQPTLDDMHTAASKGAAARYSTRFADGFAMDFAEPGGLPNATHILKVQAFILARDGDSVGVSRNIRTMLKASTSLGNFPLQAPQFERVLLVSDVVRTLQALLPHLEFSGAELDEMKRELGALGFDRGLYNALIGERVFGLLAFQTPEPSLRAFATDYAAATFSEEDIRGLLNNVSFNIDQDRQTFEDLMSQNIAIAKLPPAERMSKATVGRDFSERTKNGTPTARRTATFSILFVPAFDVIFDFTAMGEARRDAGVVAIAIQQFRLRENKPPQALSELVPEFLPAIPIDPYDGQPLKYDLNSNRYVVYSVGNNRQDDGGSVANAADLGAEVLLSAR